MYWFFLNKNNSLYFQFEDFYPEVTALFCDIVGFVQFVANCKPSDVLAVLNTLYTEFDRLTRVHDTFRVRGP